MSNLRISTFPANQQRLWEIEQGRSSEATLTLPPGESLAAGDSIIFALTLTDAVHEPVFAKFGDSIRVRLTEVDNLDRLDLATGRAMFRIAWEPLIRAELPKPASRRDSKRSRS